MESSFPASSSITASLSGNVHSRLTASNSQRRLRAHIRSISSELHSEDMDEKQELPIEHSPILPLHRRPRISTNKLRISLRWLVTLYCFFSLALLSLHLFYGLVDDVVAISWKGTSTISPPAKLSPVLLLSRSDHLRHAAVALFPNIFAESTVRTPTSQVTLCLWTSFEQVQEVIPLLRGWKGPISLVVVSSDSPSPSFYQHVVDILKDLKHESLGGQILHAHVLLKVPKANYSPNSYLNVARLFAPTPNIVMVPGEPTMLINPRHFKAGLERAGKRGSLEPLLLSDSNVISNSTVPFDDLSPILLPRDYPLWCTERFFTVPTRALDWRECMWQFWLSSYGQLQHIYGSPWADITGEGGLQDKHDTQTRIHRRLAARFRHETCIMAGKRLKEKEGVDPRKARWLKKVCKRVLNSWERNLI